MIPDRAWGLIPDQVVGRDWAIRVANRANLSGRSRNAYLFATSLISDFLDFFEERNYLPTSYLERFRILDISAGFIPNYSKRGSNRIDFSDYEDYAFGVVIGVDESLTGRGWRFGEFGGSGNNPFILEPRTIVHNARPNLQIPSIAVSSCYVQPKPGKAFLYSPPWTNGILTVRHALQPTYTIGTRISMSNGAVYSVAEVDTFSSTIDAAILDCGALPLGASPLAIVAGLAPGDLIDVRTATTNFAATVLRIFEHPSSYSGMFGHRVFVDSVGAPGDSGSLVTKSKNGSREAVGIYLGRTNTIPDEGIVQSMRQIEKAFEILIYD